MKTEKIKYKLKSYLLILAIFLLPNIALFSQDSLSFEPSLEIFTKKNFDYTRTISAKLIGQGEQEELPITGAEIVFYNVQNDKKVVLGKVKTDNIGQAKLTLKKDYNYLKDAESKINLMAEFGGSKALSPTEASIAVKDLKMSMVLTENDTAKSIIVSAFFIDAKGNEIPLEETSFQFFIDGMFSKLPIGEGFLEGGRAEFAFPSNLKGNYLGNLNIYAAFVDNEDYGNVEIKEAANWGTHRSNYTEERKLWTSGAPLWMIITLSIMLAGVWSHYIYAIIQLFLIRREARRNETPWQY